jgi:hypothetical protein
MPLNGRAFNVQKSAEKSIFAVSDTWNSNTCKVLSGPGCSALRNGSLLKEVVRGRKFLELNRTDVMPGNIMYYQEKIVAL